ncbi:hypothetical protein GCM10009678_78160 [Actinomadura kijaniata]|uniref:Uncharacterized protein n=1 Tax=Actinomadura namibiensis TaxID=182080 RepID=A0A7W3LVH8_ACTNM|nr:hypothetical protein [Actinomadura namibiensis]MBA8955005.1 hypothetical protein [Actinomadura namibiensis]
MLDAGPAGVWLKNGRPGAVHGEWALYRRAGDAWREAPLPPGTSPDAVAAVPGSSAVWAVGARPDPADHGHPNSATAVTGD